MNEMLIVDIETQDFPVESGIFEVACLAVKDYEIIDELYIGKKIDGYDGPTDYGRGFHNIAKDQESILRFRNFISKYQYPIVAHNCSFEKKFFLHYDWLKKDSDFYCSLRALRYEKLDVEKHTMAYLTKYFGVDNALSHTALSDAKALYEILSIVKPKKWLKIGEKYR